MTLRIASLGSSFAAGPGIPPVLDADAGRSGRNYPHLLAERLGAELVDLTVSGATTATILDEPQTTMTGAVFPPQIDGLPVDADVVTVTAGGNDLDHIGSMLLAAFRRLDPTGPVVATAESLLPDGLQAPSQRRIAAAEAGLVRIVESVREHAPGARVLLVDYLTVVGPGTSGAEWFSADEAELFRGTSADLAGAFERAAHRSGAELVRMSAVSRDHGLGTPDPWISGPFTDPALIGASFHPDARGMERTADALAGLLA